MYRVACPECGSDYEATTASWCRCLHKDRSLICPSCRRCFCEASTTFRNQFWRDAPSELWDARREARGTDQSANPVLKKPLALVVDDDPGIRMLALELITRFGYGCLVASNGDSAIRLAKRYHPDLVLTDLLMPGIDGRELSRTLKSDPALPTPVVIVMTSVYRGEEYQGEAQEVYRVDGYLEKPVALGTLRSTLASLMPSPEDSHAELSPSAEDLDLEFPDDLEDDTMTIIG